MNGDSGESTEEDDVTDGGSGESETERQGWGWWKEAGSWFQTQGEAHRMELSVIGIKVTRMMLVDEQEWPQMKSECCKEVVQIWRLGVCEDFVSESSLYSMRSVISSQWRKHKTGVEWQDLRTLTFERVLNQLEAPYLRFREVVVKRITVIKFGVDDRGGNITGCCGTEVRADAAKLTNMTTTGFETYEIRSEKVRCSSNMKLWLWVDRFVLSNELRIFASCFSSLIMAALHSRCGHYIFCRGFYFFCPRLISAVADWMSTILPHMVWPWGEFRMKVWNVLHTAPWKYGTQKNRHLGTIAQLCRAISSQLRHVSTIGKKPVKQQ